MQKKKTGTTNARRVPIILLWVLLIGSIAFGVFNNFTAADTHTYIEREVVEMHLADTSGIESFTFNFAQVFHAWPSDSEGRAVRNERLHAFMTDELHMLNLNMLRSDADSRASLQAFQIWSIAQLDDYNFQVRYSVRQLVRVSTMEYVDETIQERRYTVYGYPYYADVVVQHQAEQYTEETVLSFFVVVVHVDEGGDMVIVRNPTVTPGVGRSDYTLPLRADGLLDAAVRAEVMQFLRDFFALYPTASESTLSSFVRNDALVALDAEYEFVDIVASAFVADGERVVAYITVQFYDPRTFSHSLSQFDLVLEKGDSWVVVERLA
ncbi:MAG: conjugal transfer protein [Oscillospiraceae bacterium]|nr:conjugal transfer protein [Oscillospiraceae bacterium]